MALTADELQARITTLRTARDSGVLTVKHGDELTTFRSLKELNEILADLEGQLAALTGTRKSRLNYVRQCTKGL